MLDQTKLVNGTVVNREMPAFHRKYLEITLTVPINIFFIFIIQLFTGKAETRGNVGKNPANQ